MSRDTLNALLHDVRADFGDEVAVIEHTEVARCVMTYKELWDTSCIVSKALSQFCSRIDQSTQFIGVCIDQCLIFPAVILGVFQHGFAFACVDPLWENERKIEYLRKLGAPLLIHSGKEWRSTAEKQQCRAVQVRDMTLYFEILKCDGYSGGCPHPMAYAVLTSGSTGKPKVVRVPHQSIVPNIIALRKICEIDSRDIIFLSSPPTFDPSVIDMFLAFTTGASLLVTSKSIKTSAASLLRILFPSKGNPGISVLQSTPSVFNRWSEKELQQIVLGDKTSLRVLLLGGEAFPSYSKLKRCRGPGNTTQIYNIYGITEVSAWGSIHHVSFPHSNIHQTEVNNDQVPLGRALPDTILQVRDCATNSVIQTGHGEMYIGSLRRICEIDDEICADYSTPVFRPTGDIVQIEPDGNIYYVGRKDLVVKRWGHRVSLENIEDIALSHASVRNAFCFWDDVRHKLYLIVTLRDNLPVLDLHRHFVQSVRCDERMLIPDEILLVPDISLTHHGKVNRQVDLDLLDMSIPTQRKFRVEREFSQFFAQALGLTSSDLEVKALENSSFLDLGGNSMVAMTLITELETAFDSCPDDLAGLLLSGKSLQNICDRLCQYYETRPPVTKQDERNPQPRESHKILMEQGLQDNMTAFTSDSSYDEDIEATLKKVEMIFSWKVNLGKCIDASPLCVVYESGETGIIIGSHSGKFINVDGQKGIEQWSLTLPSRIESTAGCSACGQNVYIGCYNGVLYCVDTPSGKVKWDFACEAERLKGIPVGCNENKTIIFGSYDSHTYCICSESGDLVWRFSEPEEAGQGRGSDHIRKGNWHASPLVIGEFAILCCLSGNVYAVKTRNKALIWKLALKQPIFSTPVYFSVSTGTYVVIALVKGSLHCVNVFSGKEVWSWQAGGFVYAPLTVVPATYRNTNTRFKILVSCYDSHLYCLAINDMNQFSLEWTVNLDAALGSAAFPFYIRTKNRVNSCFALVSNKNGVLSVISIHTGVIYCQYEIGAEVFSTPVVHGDRVYFGCRDDHLYSLIIKCSEVD